MHHYKWNLENNINHLQYYKCNLENAYKFFFVLILELKYFANDKCMDLIAHASLPTLFQNKFWCIIGIKSKCKLPFKLFMATTIYVTKHMMPIRLFNFGIQCKIIHTNLKLFNLVLCNGCGNFKYQFFGQFNNNLMSQCKWNLENNINHTQY